MRRLKTLRLRLRSLLRPERVDRELDEELRDHLRREIDAQVARGASPKEARLRALAEFGSVANVEDQCRDQRGLSLIDDLVRDLRHGLRSMRRSPGFTAVAALSLALGIGANTAIFSLTDALLLRSLPVAGPRELVELGRITQYGPGGSFSYPIFERVRDGNAVFQGVLTISTSAIEANVDTDAQRPTGRFVSGNFFELLGLAPSAGRLFSPDDDRPDAEGGAAKAVIAHGFWQRQFGGRPDVIGRTLQVDRIAFAIVGVAPPGFEGLQVGRPVDFYIPIASEPLVRARSWLGHPDFNWLAIVGRLKPGTTIEMAQSDLGVVFARFLDEYVKTLPDPESQRNTRTHRLTAQSAHAGLSALRRQFSRPLAILMGTVAIVLLIACANVVTLLLARGLARERDLSLRRMLGASRWRLARQLLTESALIGVVGGALGLLLAAWTSPILVRLVAAGDPRIALDVTPDARILLFTLVVSLSAALGAGLAPALRFARGGTGSLAQGDVRTLHVSRQSNFWMRTLIVAQVALSLILLVGASLLVASVRNLRSFDAGFERNRVLMMGLEPGRGGFEKERRLQYYREVLDRVRRVPGTADASVSLITPVSGGGVDLSLSIGGQRQPGAVYVNYVSDRYFSTMRTRLLSGRDFEPRESPETPQVAIVNEALVRRYFQTVPAIGQRVTLGQRSELEIVGVVANAKYLSLREEDHPTIYVNPMQTLETGGLSLCIRAIGDPMPLAPAVRRELRALAPAVPLGPPTLLSVEVDRSIVNERLVTNLLGAFAGLALLLASVGLYGVLAYTVARRTSEIGVRLALGASRASILWSVVRGSWWLVAAGAALGVPAALGLTRLLGTLLYGITPTDPVVIAGSVACLFLVALTAASVPAWRASRVDPLVALRHE
jgi:predicted permease